MSRLLRFVSVLVCLALAITASTDLRASQGSAAQGDRDRLVRHTDALGDELNFGGHPRSGFRNSSRVYR